MYCQGLARLRLLTQAKQVLYSALPDTDTLKVKVICTHLWLASDLNVGRQYFRLYKDNVLHNICKGFLSDNYQRFFFSLRKGVTVVLSPWERPQVFFTLLILIYCTSFSSILLMCMNSSLRPSIFLIVYFLSFYSNIAMGSIWDRGMMN